MRPRIEKFRSIYINRIKQVCDVHSTFRCIDCSPLMSPDSQLFLLEYSLFLHFFISLTTYSAPLPLYHGFADPNADKSPLHPLTTLSSCCCFYRQVRQRSGSHRDGYLEAPRIAKHHQQDESVGFIETFCLISL